jgi:hypothetical protein
MTAHRSICRPTPCACCADRPGSAESLIDVVEVTTRGELDEGSPVDMPMDADRLRR